MGMANSAFHEQMHHVVVVLISMTVCYLIDGTLADSVNYLTGELSKLIYDPQQQSQL